jgi:hypothetical protein
MRLLQQPNQTIKKIDADAALDDEPRLAALADADAEDAYFAGG